MLPKIIAGGHKTLIFCQMTQVLDIIQQYLEFKKIKNVRLDGTMKSEDRTQSIDNFKEDKEVMVFLLSTKAGGHGLNL